MISRAGFLGALLAPLAAAFGWRQRPYHVPDDGPIPDWPTPIPDWPTATVQADYDAWYNAQVDAARPTTIVPRGDFGDLNDPRVQRIVEEATRTAAERYGHCGRVVRP